MASILVELRKLVTPELISETSRQTHEADAAVTKAYDAAIPAYAATIANRSDDHGFISQLVDLATTAAADPDPVTSAMRLASPTSVETTMRAGGWMSSLFDENLSTVTDSLARYAGIRESSASSLLLTCAPLVLGYLGRLIRTHDLSASGLAERLQQERPYIASGLPSGFEMPAIARQPYETNRAVMDEEIRPRQPQREWAVPLAAWVAVVGIASLFWLGRTPVRHQPTQAKIETAAPNAVGTTGTVNPLPTRGLPENPNLAFPAGGTEDRLASYLASPGTGSITVNLNRVGFESGSARLTPESREQVGNIAAILRAYPKATVAIAGHTDNVGSEAANLALSRARAETVASGLRNAGVAADRVRVEAYGSDKPVADNSTEHGRAQNRRVTLDVTR
jgi:OmpA-OmpF porin, OOP family